jgi:beta-glucanase (GH16 family)
MSGLPVNGGSVRRAGLLAMVVGVLQLAGCGGGDDSAPAAATPPPPAPAPPVAAPPAPAPPAPAPPVAAGPAPAGYTLVWADEFETPGLPDAARWGYDTERNRLGWYNAERQYYAAARTQNSVVEGGRLRITARREALSSLPDWGGQAYSSARLITRGKASWTYGFFEIRAKMPCGTGTWPAIWMLGTGGVWPDDGEIDILEHVGRNPGEILGTVHTRSTLDTVGGSGSGTRTSLPTACTEFHNYQLLWTADEIAIGVNGIVYHRYRNPRSGRAAWPFDAPQYLLLNIAVGGTLGGAVDDSIFPRTMEIEHVRVWQAPR